VNGLAIGGVLALLAAAWVLAPLLRAVPRRESDGVAPPVPLEAGFACSACGAEQEPGARFCASCGIRLAS